MTDDVLFIHSELLQDLPMLSSVGIDLVLAVASLVFARNELGQISPERPPCVPLLP